MRAGPRARPSRSSKAAGAVVAVVLLAVAAVAMTPRRRVVARARLQRWRAPQGLPVAREALDLAQADFRAYREQACGLCRRAAFPPERREADRASRRPARAGAPAAAGRRVKPGRVALQVPPARLGWLQRPGLGSLERPGWLVQLESAQLESAQLGSVQLGSVQLGSRQLGSAQLGRVPRVQLGPLVSPGWLAQPEQLGSVLQA